MLSSYQASPRRGHLQQAYPIFAYIKNQTKLIFCLDPTPPKIDLIIFWIQMRNWWIVSDVMFGINMIRNQIWFGVHYIPGVRSRPSKNDLLGRQLFTRQSSIRNRRCMSLNIIISTTSLLCLASCAFLIHTVWHQASFHSLSVIHTQSALHVPKYCNFNHLFTLLS